MPKIVVSACLAGESCRYDGGHKRNDVLARLLESGQAIAVCPEVLGGLPVPRSPYEVLEGRVVGKGGEDVTREFESGAMQAVEQALEHGCTLAVLQPRSPSCGSGTIYDGSFQGRLIPGDGVFAAALKRAGIQVMAENEWMEQNG